MESTFGYVIIFDLTQKKIKYPLYLNYWWSYKLLKRLANKKRHGQAVYKIFYQILLKCNYLQNNMGMVANKTAIWICDESTIICICASMQPDQSLRFTLSE